jgi:hypothetical protein
MANNKKNTNNTAIKEQIRQLYNRIERLDAKGLWITTGLDKTWKKIEELETRQQGIAQCLQRTLDNITRIITIIQKIQTERKKQKK